MESQLARDELSRASPPSRLRQPFVQISLLISLFSLLIFFGIVDIVLKQRPLLQIDTIVAEYLRQHTTPLGMGVMTFFPGFPFLAYQCLLCLARWRWCVAGAGMS